MRFVTRKTEVLARTEKAIKRGLTDAGMVWHGDAVRAAPVDSGLLRASIAWAVGKRRHHGEATGVDGSRVTSSYAVSAPPDTVRLGSSVEYAVPVHEDVSGRIPRPGGAGGPKFIETPLRENQDRYIKLVRDALRKAFPS